MNKIINKFLFTGETFMPELYLKQTVFICGQFTRHRERIKKQTVFTCGQFTKHRERIKKFRKKIA